LIKGYAHLIAFRSFARGGSLSEYFRERKECFPDSARGEGLTRFSKLCLRSFLKIYSASRSAHIALSDMYLSSVIRLSSEVLLYCCIYYLYCKLFLCILSIFVIQLHDCLFGICAAICHTYTLLIRPKERFAYWTAFLSFKDIPIFVSLCQASLCEIV
jgi:hypothetical protein